MPLFMQTRQAIDELKIEGAINREREGHLAGWDEVGKIAEVAGTENHGVGKQHPNIDTKFMLLLGRWSE